MIVKPDLGAQAYGHGLYFAENESIARYYRDQLSRENPAVSEKALADPELTPVTRTGRRGGTPLRQPERAEPGGGA